MVKKLIKRLFSWIFAPQLKELDDKIKQVDEKINQVAAIKLRLGQYEKTLDNVLSNIDVSVDIDTGHRHATSWAVISLQGKKSDYIKFIELGDAEINHIQKFLKRFERCGTVKIDAGPKESHFLKFN